MKGGRSNDLKDWKDRKGWKHRKEQDGRLE